MNWKCKFLSSIRISAYFISQSLNHILFYDKQNIRLTRLIWIKLKNISKNMSLLDYFPSLFCYNLLLVWDDWDLNCKARFKVLILFLAFFNWFNWINFCLFCFANNVYCLLSYCWIKNILVVCKCERLGNYFDCYLFAEFSNDGLIYG